MTYWMQFQDSDLQDPSNVSSNVIIKPNQHEVHKYLCFYVAFIQPGIKSSGSQVRFGFFTPTYVAGADPSAVFPAEVYIFSRNPFLKTSWVPKLRTVSFLVDSASTSAACGFQKMIHHILPAPCTPFPPQCLHMSVSTQTLYMCISPHLHISFPHGDQAMISLRPHDDGACPLSSSCAVHRSTSDRGQYKHEHQWRGAWSEVLGFMCLLWAQIQFRFFNRKQTCDFKVL